MTPERIARLWDLVHGGDPGAQVCVGIGLVRSVLSTDRIGIFTEVRSAQIDRTSVRAYGLTDDEALGALWELVVLHARMRRDEINAAMSAEGMRV